MTEDRVKALEASLEFARELLAAGKLQKEISGPDACDGTDAEGFLGGDDRLGVEPTTLDSALRHLAASEARVEELEALFQQTHGCHVSWVHKVTELEGRLRNTNDALKDRTMCTPAERKVLEACAAAEMYEHDGRPGICDETYAITTAELARRAEVKP